LNLFSLMVDIKITHLCEKYFPIFFFLDGNTINMI
jgi:hypothetical protein